MTQITIGINPLTWTNDDLPSLGADTPLETCLSEARQAGFTGIELGNKFPRDPEVLKPILAEHDINLVSGWYSTELLSRDVEAEIEAVQGHLTLLKATGCKVMVCCEVTDCIHGAEERPLTKRPHLTESQWAQFCERLSGFAEYLASEGVNMAYHHHMGTVIQSEAEVNRMMESTSDAVGLLVDTGHMTFAGGDPMALLKRWSSRVNHVHCKDIRPAVLKDALNRDLPFLKAVLNGLFTVPGDGSIDYYAVLKELKAMNYSGWIVVEAEQDPSIADPLTFATKGYVTLADAVKQAGF